MAPLIESLAGAQDVRGTLSRRFNMTKWFQAQGLLLPKAPPHPMHRAPSMPMLPSRASGPPQAEALRQAQHVQHAQHPPSGVEMLQQRRTGSGILLMLDFDRTVIDYDAGELGEGWKRAHCPASVSSRNFTASAAAWQAFGGSGFHWLCGALLCSIGPLPWFWLLSKPAACTNISPHPLPPCPLLAGERVTDELAPELTSLLSSLEMPANFVPVTNTVLAEMQRRGVSRDKLLHTLRAMGQEVPLASVRMLQVRAGMCLCAQCLRGVGCRAIAGAAGRGWDRQGHSRDCRAGARKRHAVCCRGALLVAVVF